MIVCEVEIIHPFDLGLDAPVLFPEREEFLQVFQTLKHMYSPLVPYKSLKHFPLLLVLSFILPSVFSFISST